MELDTVEDDDEDDVNELVTVDDDVPVDDTVVLEVPDIELVVELDAEDVVLALAEKLEKGLCDTLLDVDVALEETDCD